MHKKCEKFIKDNNGQVGAEMLLLIGGMMIIVLIAIHFYNDYLSGIGNEITSTELNKLNDSIKNLSVKFKWDLNFTNISFNFPIHTFLLNINLT